MYYLVRYALSRLDVDDKEQANRKSAAAAVLRKLDIVGHDEEAETNTKDRRSRKEDLVLNKYEQLVAMDVVAPDDIPVAFEGDIFPESVQVGLRY